MLKDLFLNIRKNKIFYYARNYFRLMLPALLYERSLKRKLATLSKYNNTEIYDRVNYYNKLTRICYMDDSATALADMQIRSPKAYYFDTFEYTRYFDKSLKIKLLAGDITHIPNVPSLQKSRPINGDNLNAVLLKLDKKRHFFFVNDHIPFSQKKGMLIGRGTMSQPHRIAFMDRYFNHPLCNLGEVRKSGGKPEWIKPKITIRQHLEYKFILSLEGNDVATNLKWIMSSNSIAVMPKPKYETWFMEGKLIPDYHYIQISDDYSDLEEKLNFYLINQDRAMQIIANANNFTKQFFDKQKEDLIALLILEKYFYYTGQTYVTPNHLT